MFDQIPQIPFADWIDIAVDWITNTFSFIFNPIRNEFGDFIEWTAKILSEIPPIIIILLVVVGAFFITGRKFGLAIFSLIGLIFVLNQGLWSEMMFTFTLVLISSLLSVLIGVPVGIIMAKSKIVESIMLPILDLMQTMPAFVYLIPAVAFFSIGMVPGVFASLIFATPPTVRFTNLAIRQVSTEIVEAAEAFGSTGFQRLFKVELPMSKTTIMAGVNQTVMLSLSMVVIASMIGAPGLGRPVLSALQRANAGPGFVAGISIVILAIIIDRFIQNIYKDK